MFKGKQLQLRAAVALIATLTGVASFGYAYRSNGVAQATHSNGNIPSTAQKSTYYPLKADTLITGVLAPLNSLRIMQRAIASAPGSDVDTIPTLALLAAPLKTTGLGPIRIGMDLEDLPAQGLTPVAIENTGNGECQFYRIKDHSEPLGLMAINGKILRIDVWPGSLTTTRSGITIGSTERDLVSAYGDRLEATANSETLGKTVVFTPADPGEDIYRLVFETDAEGRVVQFRAGQFPSVTWPEGCL